MQESFENLGLVEYVWYLGKQELLVSICRVAKQNLPCDIVSQAQALLMKAELSEGI